MSPKSVAQKLLIKPNTSVWLSDRKYLERLEPLPEGVEVVAGQKDANTCLLFVENEASLRQLLTEHGDCLGLPETSGSPTPKGTRQI